MKLVLFALLLVFAPMVTWAEKLKLADVLDAALSFHPSLTMVLEQREEKAGKQLSAEGAFDAKFKTESKAYAAGFYEGRYVDSYVTKPIASGGIDLYSGVRISDGSFPDYDGDLATTEDGELRFGAIVPLLRDRAIDERRGELAIQEQEVLAAGQKVIATKLKLARAATIAYWSWVADAMKVEVIRDLVKVAKLRNAQLEAQVEAGDKPRFDLTDNNRSVLKREGELVKVENSLFKSALKLSFYYRDNQSRTLIPKAATSSPRELPEPNLAEFFDLDESQLVQEAFEKRPEFQMLDVRRNQVGTALDLANNEFLPQLDLDLMAGQDFGAGKASLQQGEVKIGLKVEVPLQYRKPRGKRNSALASSAVLDAERTVLKDQIAIEVRKLIQSVSASLQKLSLASAELKAARELEKGELIKFNQGDSNLIFVNLREQTAAEAAINQISALLEYHILAAELRAGLGRVWGLPQQ